MPGYTVRLAEPEDEPFLWHMLYYAAHMERDGIADLDAAKHNAYLIRYVQGWGASTDLGLIGLHQDRPIGAVWSRLLIGEDKTPGYIDDQTPELAAAVLPEHVGQGAGTLMLHVYLAEARRVFPAVVLNVRADNPAFRLYQRAGFQVVDVITNRVGTKSYNMVIRW